MRIKKICQKFKSHQKFTRADFFIQIYFSIYNSLSIYTEKVQAGKFNFPTFSECCPLCHGKDCAVRIGYYYRTVIHLGNTIDESFVQEIPVARYLCREKQKRKHSHKTFSLLPDTLIPNYSITIDTLIFILQLLLNNNYTSYETFKNIDFVSPGDILFSEESLLRYCALFNQTRIKLILFFQRTDRNYRAPPDIESFTSADMLRFVIDFIHKKRQSLHGNAWSLSHLYYIRNGAYVKNAHFLFGTASQFL